MAYFKMSNPGINYIDKAITACQMSMGCIVEWFNDSINIVSFEVGDKELIIDTLNEFGSIFITDLAIA